MIRHNLKQVLTDIIRQAGVLIQERSQAAFEIYSKDSINNLVTEVDREAELLIKEEVKKLFPTHGFLAEEYGAEDEQADYIWIIDPIDGTVNYAHGVPLYCVSIAIAYQEEVIMGAIYSPVMDELFLAELGAGAWLNDKPIQVSSNDEYQKAFLVTGFPYHYPEGVDITAIFNQFIQDKLPVRRLGSAALDLAYVACGRFDGFWEYNLSPWDIAAGYLLVKEAGGQVTDFNGVEGHYHHKQTLATNQKLHEALLSKIQQYTS